MVQSHPGSLSASEPLDPLRRASRLVSAFIVISQTFKVSARSEFFFPCGYSAQPEDLCLISIDCTLAQRKIQDHRIILCLRSGQAKLNIFNLLFWRPDRRER